MELKIRSVKENPLLDRRELTVDVDHEGEPTPSKEDVKSRLAAEHGLDKESVEIVGVYTPFGKNLSTAEIKVYEDFEYDEELVEETVEEGEAAETGAEEAVPEEYEELVSGTISDAKDALKEMDNPDWDAAIEAEKANKNRTTLIDWLEGQE